MTDINFQMDCLAVWDALCENPHRYRAIFEDGGTAEAREFTIRTLTPWVNEVFALASKEMDVSSHAYDWGWVPAILQQIADHRNLPAPASVVASSILSVEA